MRSGIILGFLGILLMEQCLCLRMEQNESSLSGAYFSNVGTYNFVDTRDDTFLTSYMLTGLENALANAQIDKKMRFLDEIEKLERNLNEIYKVCKKNRANYLPYGTSSIPESQLKSQVDKALSDSNAILSDLVSLSSKNYTDKFGIEEKMNKTDKYNTYNYLYPTYVKDFEVAKKYINFTFSLEKISNSAALIKVNMAVPVLVKAELNRINYVPMQDGKTKTFRFLRDQSISNIAVRASNSYNYNYDNGYYLIKNIDSCDLVNEMFLCDPAIVTKVNYYRDSCLTLLLKSDCSWESGWSCEQARDRCVYEESTTRYKEFTYLGNNKFFALLTREASYIYKCGDGRVEEGKLVFRSYGDNKYAGTIEIDDNCSLITAYSTISNQNGVYEIKEVDNEELIWADVPKIIGIPIWIFAISVAVVALIVLIMLVTWICICVRRCKKNKANQYANLNASS